MTSNLVNFINTKENRMRKIKSSLDEISVRGQKQGSSPKQLHPHQKQIRDVYKRSMKIPFLPKLNTSHDRSLSVDSKKLKSMVVPQINLKNVSPRGKTTITSTPRTVNLSRSSSITSTKRRFASPLGKKDLQLIEKYKTVIPNITTIDAKSPKGKVDFLIFTPNVNLGQDPPKSKIRQMDMYYYRFINGETPIIKSILAQHNFQEANANCYISLTWVIGIVKPEIYPTLNYYEKINHFPKSFNITRKDLLHRNISKMQILHGHAYFDFIPKSFILPLEFFLLEEDYEKYKGEMWYIVKPQASSQGKGIFITDSLDRIAEKRENQVIVSHYIRNPFLINGLKFDLRIYVALTSIHPLRIYMFEEGLVRFATEPYSFNIESQGNQFVHLTNYSINKLSEKFVKNDLIQEEEKSSKWSLKTFKTYLESIKIDANDVFARIEDVIIKTIISMESTVFQATCTHVPNRNNCFDLFGFDILLDSNLKPWLLEVNLSPSLACESAIDTKIKSELLSDLFNLIGIVPLGQRTHSHMNKFGEPHSGFKNPNSVGPFEVKKKSMSIIIPEARSFENMTKEEKIIIHETNEEWLRRGKFKRIFPGINSSEYRNFFEQDRPYNKLLRELVSYNVKKVTGPQKLVLPKREPILSPTRENIYSPKSQKNLNQRPPIASPKPKVLPPMPQPSRVLKKAVSVSSPRFVREKIISPKVRQAPAVSPKQQRREAILALRLKKNRSMKFM